LVSGVSLSDCGNFGWRAHCHIFQAASFRLKCGCGVRVKRGKTSRFAPFLVQSAAKWRGNSNVWTTLRGKPFIFSGMQQMINTYSAEKKLLNFKRGVGGRGVTR
jgi:hypothetical protein